MSSSGLSGGARRAVIVLTVVVWVVLWVGSLPALAPLAANLPVSDAGDSRSDPAAAVATCDLGDDHALPSLLHVAPPAPLVFCLSCGRLPQAGRSLPPAVRPPISVA
jgi:hypothetical protein